MNFINTAHFATFAIVTTAASFGLSTRHVFEPFDVGRCALADPRRAAVAPLAQSTHLRGAQNGVAPLLRATSLLQAHRRCRPCHLIPSNALPEVSAVATAATPALCKIHSGLLAATTRHRCLGCSGRQSSQNCQDTSSPWHQGQWLLDRGACAPAARVDYRAKI